MTHPTPTHPPTPSVPGPPKFLARLAEPIRVTAQLGWALTVLTYDVAADIYAAREARRNFNGRRA